MQLSLSLPLSLPPLSLSLSVRVCSAVVRVHVSLYVSIPVFSYVWLGVYTHTFSRMNRSTSSHHLQTYSITHMKYNNHHIKFQNERERENHLIIKSKIFSRELEWRSSSFFWWLLCMCFEFSRLHYLKHNVLEHGIIKKRVKTSSFVSPWYNHNGWLGVKHQATNSTSGFVTPTTL